MTVLRKQPYIWVTWLSKVMAGEQACLWASWFKAHHQDYPKVPSNFDLASWNVEHTRLLIRTRTKWGARGADVRTEGQNAFRYRHPCGAVLAGKPDLLAIEDGEAVVLDCKTGRPRLSDRLQVQIYMAVLPFCFPELKKYPLCGAVVYPDDTVEVPARAVDARFHEHLDYFINLFASESPTAAAPNARECRFCDITESDCPERLPLPVLRRSGCRPCSGAGDAAQGCRGPSPQPCSSAVHVPGGAA
jgi:hypothetical protein